MNITYDYYRIFYYVAKYRSITMASNILYSSQPNVTRAIKKLESELGCTLFVRSNRGMTLTHEGEKLFSHVSVAFEHIEAGEKELALDKSLQEGHISISVTDIALHCVTLPTLGKFHKMHPGVKIRLSNHSTPQAINSVKSGFSDIAIVTSPTSVRKPLKEVAIKPIHEVAVCSTYFAELGEGKIKLKELMNYPLIFHEANTNSYDFYYDFFMSKGLTPQPDIEASTTNQILAMVRNDLGIGFVPLEFLGNDIDRNNLIIIDLEEQIPRRNICLIKNTEHSQGVVPNEFEKMIIEENLQK